METFSLFLKLARRITKLQINLLISSYNRSIKEYKNKLLIIRWKEWNS